MTAVVEDPLTAPVEEVDPSVVYRRPGSGELELMRKHEEQMFLHQANYGVFGVPQTKKQKQAMARDIKALEAAGFIPPVDAEGS